MVTLEATFRAAEGITPDLAVEIIQRASKFDSVTELELDNKRVVLGSLIGILSLEIRGGTRLRIIAHGRDEIDAAGSIRELIEA
ncbi:MAG: HPr family phosphocarrier protein [Christensenellales bacterium]|jgi:phosphotransferase system HPr (HPr) family protein